MSIINNNDFTLTPTQQQGVINGFTNMGINSDAIVGEKFEDEDDTILIPIYFDMEGENGEVSEEFAFNINENGEIV